MVGGPFHSRRARRRPTINITSLIDVMFLLLIFLLVSSTFHEYYGIDITLPEAETAADHEGTSQEILVTREGHYYFGEQWVDEAGLRQALVQLLQKEPEADVVLRADTDAEFGKVIRAIDIARDAGTTRLIIPTRYLGDRID